MKTPLSSASFADFFTALWGYSPFPWQVEFASRVCAGKPPRYVTAPTGSGKTACLEAAVFALAVQSSLPPDERTVGRRIFFIVNRRIIVDEAYTRAKKLKAVLNRALNPKLKPGEKPPAEILVTVAQRLRDLAGGEGNDPLACTELRGGIYRDRAWAKSLIQPMILCSTVDQTGSRLLFRGYGVSCEARPIHAALVAQDSLLLIDEAHISQPFLDTLDWVTKYRQFGRTGDETLHLPFSAVRMTATPPAEDEGERLGLSESDRQHEVLARRLGCPKYARLVNAPKAKGKAYVTELVKVLESEAGKILKEKAPPSLAVMVNRVATARKIAEALKDAYKNAEVTLVLGRMRPLDRDRLTDKLQKALRTGQEQIAGGEAKTQIVVSTQCLEVGADLDFASLVTECASIDALRQRFGRLNRDGKRAETEAVIVLPEEQNIEEKKLTDAAPADPIYGNAIPLTWLWLKFLASENKVDFGINAMGAAAETERTKDEGAAFSKLLSPHADAPVMLPAYLDCWVQTNPAPAADPDVALFLHGPRQDMAEVQVCWRADLPEHSDAGGEGEGWAETLALCPPTLLECLPVPLHLMRQWLESSGTPANDMTGDAPANAPESEPEKKDADKAMRTEVMVWGGPGRSSMLKNARDLRPGDTLVLRAQSGGWSILGHLPDTQTDPATEYPDLVKIDLAETGQAIMKRRAVVRLHPAVWDSGEKNSPRDELMKYGQQAAEGGDRSKLKELIEEAAESLSSDQNFLKQRLDHLAKESPHIDLEPYPQAAGVVLTSKIPFSARLEAEGITDDEGDAEDGTDDPLLEQADQKAQSLTDHTADVSRIAVRYATELGLLHFLPVIRQAAELHDWGKADHRFQALLIGGDAAAGLARQQLLAKSANIAASPQAKLRARQRAGLPAGFRHEMLSMQLACNGVGRGLLPEDEGLKDLVLHLIASHHGHARPWAPVVNDDEPPAVTLKSPLPVTTLSGEERLANPAHALDSGVAERFWELTRRYGWWGLALLETVLRLADQYASAKPSTAEKS